MILKCVNFTLKVIVNIWVKKFEEDPRSGTIKLFTVIINCFDVDVCVDAFTNFNSVVMFEKITGCFKALVCSSN